jgi:intracellular multiplication protein IcmE
MGQRMKNMVAVLGDAKARGIIILLFVVALIIFLITFVSIRHQVAGPATGAELAGTPGIRAIPGVGEPTREYVKLQEQQNVQLAEEALKAQTAAIPTLTRTTYLDSGALLGEGDKAGCSAEELRRAREAGVTVSELRCRGCSLNALKDAGFSAGELMKAGFAAKELHDAGFTALDLKNAGFNAADLKAAGFNAIDLKNAGFSPSELKAVGISALDLKNAGFTPEDLVKAGFNAQELQAAGYSAKDLLNAGITPTDLKNAKFSDQDLKAAGVSDAAIAAARAASQNCSVDNLRALHTQGISSTALKDMGCSVAALKTAGFTVAELKAAGFPAKELKDGGFTADVLKDAGFSAKDLHDAGFSAGELRQAGFQAGDLKDAGFSAKDLKGAGFSGSELHNAGFTAPAMRNAGFSEGELVRSGFSQEAGAAVPVKPTVSETAAAKLMQSGLSIKDLLRAGVTPAQLKKAGFTDQDLKNAGLSSAEITKVSEETKAVPVTEVKVTKKPKQKGTWLENFIEQRKERSAKLSEQEYGDTVKQVQQTMSTQAGELFSSWVPLPTQQYTPGEEEKEITGGGGATGAAPTGAETQLAAASGDVYKAGTILFAVLDTGINSDEQSPVLATIVQGKLNGAKILGNFQRVEKKVLLQFNMLSVPYLTGSVPINAVAIDQNTARTALATNVNSHYMLRYGNLFASAFVSGLGQAVQTSGSSTQTGVNGSQQNFFPKLNAGDKALVAIGNVGQQFGNVLGNLFNTPPTVEVKPGSGIGILIMADLSVPKNGESKS